jgi:hypothetical protein
MRTSLKMTGPRHLINPLIQDSDERHSTSRKVRVYYFSSSSGGISMRVALALAALLSLVSAAAANAAPTCQRPVSEIVERSAYFAQAMKPAGKATDNSATYRNKDDARMIVNFEADVPSPSAGLSRSEYMRKYERAAAIAAEGAREPSTSFFPYEPLAWRIIDTTTLPDVGDALEGRMDIRLTETCLIRATFIAPSSDNLRSRWSDMVTAVAGLRETSKPFALSTDWEREDTAPTGALALAVGWIAPLLVVGILYHSLRHFSRLDPPTKSTKTIVGALAAMAIGLAIQQREFFATGLSIIKYTDTLLLLVTCAVACLSAVLLDQKATVLGLITGAVTGASLLASSAIGWTPDVVSMSAVGGSMLVVAVMGFVSWSHSSSSAPA